MNKEELVVPYNISNILITVDCLKKIFSKYDIEINVKDINLYIESLTHKSYVLSEYTSYHSYNLKKIKNEMKNSVLELMNKSSERLEFLGDTVIKCLVSKYICIRYYNEDEGFLTRIKTKIENRKSLAAFAKLIGIDKYIIISLQIELNNGRDSDKLLEDCFEAFIGALFIDQGFEICEKLLFKLLESEIDYSEILYKDNNFKDKLLRYFHQNNWSHPIYEDLSSEIINNKKYFTVIVKNKLGNKLAEAQELSKKKAEQKAAMLTLIKYNQLNSDQIVNEFDT